MKKDYLPIGTIVLLKGGKKKLMIPGFYVSAEGYNETFDYCACLYPEGVISSKENGVFNHDQIEQVIYRGYDSEEEKAFKERLYEAINKKNNQ